MFELSNGFPRISYEINRPAAKTVERSSMSLLVRTDSGDEYLRSWSSTRSRLVRSPFAKASMCAILMERKLLLMKSDEGLISLGTILF